MPSSLTARTVRSIALALSLVPLTAEAALRDHGPVSAQTGFPTWYRDTTGLALEPCIAQTASPNASAGGAPMCFPWVTDPAGFAGNWGDEQFYAAADAALTGNGFTARLVLALEAAYLNGTPVRGDELVFARVRVIMDVTAPGTYRVTHPYGIEVFENVQPGSRAVTFTQDIGLIPGNFAAALAGKVGPFLRWDILDLDPASGVPYSLTVNGEEYLGDPNVAHTVTGSPFGTNFFMVEGPPGSNLDFAGNDFALTPFFNVVGKRYLQPIPSPLAVTRAVYGHDGTTLQVDVHAESAPGAALVVNAGALPTTQMAGDAGGHYFATVAVAGVPGVPAEVTVTNLSDAPTHSVVAPLVDAVSIWSATYDATTGILDVAAYSSDNADGVGPALALVADGASGPLSSSAGNPALKTVAVPTAVPPAAVVIESSAGGSERAHVKVIASAPVDPALAPVAVPDAVTTGEDQPISIPVLANDAPSSGTVMLIGQPAHGGAIVNPLTMAIDYTPAANFSGTDELSYFVQDASGRYSNVASVTITVVAVNDPPIAAADAATTSAGVATVIAVLANDSDPDGTIVPGTLAVAGTPVGGTATVNPDATITFTPAAGFVGTARFGYTVQDDLGATSNVGTVTVTVTAAAEQLSTSRVQYEADKRRWRIDGSSSVFGPNVANTVTFYNGPTTASPVMGTAAINATGGFQWQPTPGSVPAPDATRRLTIRSTGGGQVTVTVTLK